MHNIVYKELAQEDLFSIFDTIAEDSPTLALEYIDKLEETINLLSTNPLLGLECKRKNIHRECRILIFENYLIVYQISEQEIVIIRVLHSKLDYVNLV